MAAVPIKIHKRPYMAVENQLVTEYFIRYFPGYRCYTQVRLGDLPERTKAMIKTPSEWKVLAPRRRWIDGIAISEEKVVLVEAAIRLDAEHFGKILLYDLLFPYTPELKEHWDKPRELQIIYVIRDDAIIALCKKHNIYTMQFRPEWIEPYIAKLPARMRRGTYFPGAKTEEEG